MRIFMGHAERLPLMQKKTWAKLIIAVLLISPIVIGIYFQRSPVGIRKIRAYP